MDDHNRLHTKIDSDGLTAWMIMPEGFDRTQLTPMLCDAALIDAGIELSAQTKQMVEQFIGDATAATPGPYRAVIARGTPPQHGRDGRVVWHVGENTDNTDREPEATSSEPRAEGEGEAVSFYDRSAFTVVEAGEVLATVSPPTPGVDGRDVTGKTLAARDGRHADLRIDETILLRNGEALAQAGGVLDRSGTTICIRDTIEVDQSIDFNTGNIRFNGNVVVHKGVRDCFTVDAMKDVEVRGLIEAAHIIAGGDLRALGGFAGREQGKAEVSGTLYAKYLDAVEARVRGDLCVEREVINCRTVVLGRVNSPRGSIIGGQTRVAGPIEVNELGAEGLPLTLIHVGCVPHLDPLIRLLAELTEHLSAQREKLLDEQLLIQKNTGARPTATHQERLCELMYEVAEVQTHLERAEPSLQRAAERAEAMRAVDITVNRRVYPNTVLVCAGLRYRIKNELSGPLRITLNAKGQLMIGRGGGEPAMLARMAELGEAA